MRSSRSWAMLVFATLVAAGSITDVKHVVLFMQENRAFDHYFGTMAGVRGFSDPNVQYNPSTGRNTFQQKINLNTTTAKTLLPFYINYLGGNWTAASQCASAGSNSWLNNHLALNGDLNDQWAYDNTPMSWAHFRRDELGVQFALAEGWTTADMYQEGVIASTSPNRVIWMSGSIGCPGGPQNVSQGGMVTDNSGTPGCEAPGLNCIPLYWKTVPEYHQDAGVSWMVYQDEDNFGDDLLIDSFAQYQNAPPDSPLTIYGASYPGLQKFYDDAAAGTLPLVSWIVGPAELSEHATYGPQDGAWLQKRVTDAVVNSQSYNSTVLMISYDETGGWGDHVTPFHSPKGTPGEWVQDPYNVSGYTYTGPGFRVPFTIISPWTRGGNVFTEHADHNSQILFVEHWLEKLGYTGVVTDEMPAWRRSQMSNLVSAFDFEHPDFSIPAIPDVPTPVTDKDGKWDAASICESKYGHDGPPIPYGRANQALNPSTLSEDGFKSVRGYLTEGRYLVFEMGVWALANTGLGIVSATPATAKHESRAQRWILHATGGTAVVGGAGSGSFLISSAYDGSYIGAGLGLFKNKEAAETFEVTDLGSRDGYTLVASDVGGLGIVNRTVTGACNGTTSGIEFKGFQVWSVTYQN